MLKTIFTTCCLGLAMLTSSSAQAQTPSVIAQYDFDNPRAFGNGNTTNAASAFAATTSDSNLTAGSFTAGSGFSDLNVSGLDALVVSEFLGLDRDLGTDNDLAGAITAGDFFSVTLAANQGFTLDLESLTFVVAQLDNGAQDYAVFSDVTGFSAADAIAFGDNAIPIGAITAGELQTIDLSSPDFDGLNSIEFRVVYDDRFADVDDRSLTALDTFTVNGSVVAAAVPEPSAMVVLGLGGLAMLVRRRK